MWGGTVLDVALAGNNMGSIRHRFPLQVEMFAFVAPTAEEEDALVASNAASSDGGGPLPPCPSVDAALESLVRLQVRRRRSSFYQHRRVRRRRGDRMAPRGACCLRPATCRCLSLRNSASTSGSWTCPQR